MRYLFVRRPPVEYENYTDVHIGVGKRYHQVFNIKPGLAMMWELEQTVLRSVIAEFQPKRILDFACGTGRISSFVESEFSGPEIHGIDISESMLAIARERAVRAQYHLMPADEAVRYFGERSFDFVMAFRFFPNADPALRSSVAESLARLVSDEGIVMINNHRNFWSTSYIGRRAIGQKPVGALNKDIEELFTDRGFRVIRRISLGLWPQGDTQASLLPWKAVATVERINLRALARRHTLGYNTIWLLSRGRGMGSAAGGRAA
jgi:SAM-dependent methyltransferase